MKDDELKQVYPHLSRNDRAAVIEAIHGSGNPNRALGILDDAYVASGQETYHQNFWKMIVPRSDQRRGQHRSTSRSEVQSNSRSRTEVQSISQRGSEIQRHPRSHADVQRASHSSKGRILPRGS
ncbi:uncharacterized protein LOC120178437 [Hibiscus syriacus]|uniref:uncharacterized protein LOC120178437 n=1 Tax=Hibiscus syriacus TaxID=106335 RepID=UPI001923C213|nr:uncharacterized protein LOC120178437 [Hibiscus syriacus]